MPPENEGTELSVSDLRALLTSDGAPAAPAKPATPAAAAEPAAKTTPAPEPDATADATRGADGKFKAATPKEDDEPVPAGVQKRIDKAVKAQRTAERERDEARAALANPGSQPAAGTPPAKTAQPAAAAAEPTRPKPVLKEFETYEAFNEDLVDWKLEQRHAAAARTENDRKAAEAQNAVGRAWNERVEAVKTIHSDFDEVMEDAAELPISQAMHVAIQEADRGPEIAYHLAKHPEEAERIAKLSPIGAAREIGKLEASLPAPASSAKPAAKPAAKPLPKPAQNVGGSHSPDVIDLNDPDLDMGTFKREFKKRLGSS